MNTVLLFVFAALVVSYFVMAAVTRGRPLFVPEMALDRAVPLQPVWMPVYLSLWVFSFLPLWVVRGVDLRRRTILAYITTAITAYVGFLIVPTAAPRPAVVPGDGMWAWALRTLYALDPPYNCFPSLHVAYAFLAALSAYRVHRGFGVLALSWAVLVGISTLFIKQHYVADVIAGALLALASYAIVLRETRFARSHSARSATAGSSDPARRDGHQIANRPAPANAATATASASGSRGVTPNS
jgi:membrane-associated phospholipid phosphatase